MRIKTETHNIYRAHVDSLVDALYVTNPFQLDLVASELMWAAMNEYPIYVAGNGASAALSQHWACDHLKGASNNEFNVNVISLATNVPLLTAIGNDISFDQIFVEQLRRHTTPKTIAVLVLISASGKSPNVVNAARFVKEHRPKISVVSLTGFDGEPLKSLSSVGLNIHTPLTEYETVEDAHCVYMHVLGKVLRTRLRGALKG